MTSSFPRRFDDTGTDITVDVHGCSIADAIYIVTRCAQEAYRRGRSRVVVIHGASAESGAERTIKSELERRLDDGSFEAWVSGQTQDGAGGRTTLWIIIGGQRKPGKIQVSDVVRR